MKTGFNLEADLRRLGAPGAAYLRELAKMDAIAGIRLTIPDPAEYARHVPMWMAEVLIGARKSQAGYKVSPQDAVDLRPWGLVEARGCYITAFGIAVRRELRAENA